MDHMRDWKNHVPSHDYPKTIRQYQLFEENVSPSLTFEHNMFHFLVAGESILFYLSVEDSQKSGILLSHSYGHTQGTFSPQIQVAI